VKSAKFSGVKLALAKTTRALLNSYPARATGGDYACLAQNSPREKRQQKMRKFLSRC